jgi:hypothetical protein
MKILKFARIQHEPVRGARALLTIKFMDGAGEVYSWAPKWDEAEQLFLKAINTEFFNKPESEWLPRFAKAVKETAESVSQPIQDAYKVSGRFSVVHEGKLCIGEYGDYGQVSEEHLITPLFPVTFEFLDTWLHNDVEVLVINGIAVQIRNGYSKEIYPEAVLAV